jgi:putative hydrolases of HD superfamily
MKKMKKSEKVTSLESVTRFIYEMGVHQNTPRSGFWFLGSGNQSVAEHLFRTAYIAYALSHLVTGINRHRVLLMALTHDISEGRTSDLNYVHQRYGRLAEKNAVADIAASFPLFGKEIQALFEEEQARLTPEAKLVKDADQLEFIASLRTEEVKGNLKARAWAKIVYKRLKTPMGKKVGAQLMKQHPDSWWFDSADSWFVHREEKDRGWKKKKS